MLDLEMTAQKLRDKSEAIREELPELSGYLLGMSEDLEDASMGSRWWSKGLRPAPTVRVRINVSTSVKGIVTTDTTLEHFGDLRDLDLDEILQLRTELSLRVDACYPPPPLT